MTVDVAQAWYVYSLIPTGGVLGPGMVPGTVPGVLPGTNVEAMPFGPITALASLVPRALFDRENPANRTADPQWMAACLEAHHAANVAADAGGPSLPLAFGSLFSSLDLLGEWLSPRAPALLSALARVAGQTEWALSLQQDSAVHAAWLELHDPEVRRLSEAVAAAGEGTAFLMTRRLDKARAAARLAHLDAVAATVAGALADAGFGVLDEPRQSAPSWTVLAPRPAEASCQAETLPERVRALAAGIAEAGLSLRLSGPWPAYAFARAALVEEATLG